MTREEVHSLIDNREGISVELKTCRQQVDHTVYETVCAFLNRLGGTIVMGVQDDGTIHQHLWAEMKSEENPMLSHVFGMMNYYEGVGKGMARLREYLWRYNANACVEFENSDLFRLNVILPESETQGPQSRPQSETEGPQSRPQSEEQGPQSRPQSEEQGPQSETMGD